jgi:tetratricopeptide (TPR) repeat protein
MCCDLLKGQQMRSVFVAIVFLASASAPSAAQVYGLGSHLPTSRASGQSDIGLTRCQNDGHVIAFALAIEACEQLIAEPSPDLVAAGIWYRAQNHADAGEAALAEEDFRRALDLFSAAIERNPRLSSVYNNRGAARARLGQLDAALVDYHRAAQLSHDEASPYFGQGSVLFRMGQYAAAYEAYDRGGRIAARMATSSDASDIGRCVALAARRAEFENAERFCDQAVGNSDAGAAALTARGYLRFMQGKMDGASEAFERAVQKDAYDAAALHGRGVVRVRLGRREEGEADIQRAMTMDTFEVSFYANAGLRP